VNNIFHATSVTLCRCFVYEDFECFKFISVATGGLISRHMLWNKVEGVKWNGGGAKKIFCKKTDVSDLVLLAVTK